MRLFSQSLNYSKLSNKRFGYHMCRHPPVSSQILEEVRAGTGASQLRHTYVILGTDEDFQEADFSENNGAERE